MNQLARCSPCNQYGQFGMSRVETVNAVVDNVLNAFTRAVVSLRTRGGTAATTGPIHDSLNRIVGRLTQLSGEVRNKLLSKEISGTQFVKAAMAAAEEITAVAAAVNAPDVAAFAMKQVEDAELALEAAGETRSILPWVLGGAAALAALFILPRFLKGKRSMSEWEPEDALEGYEE